MDLLEVDGSIRRIAAALGEPFVSDAPSEPNARIDLAADHPVAVVMRTGRSLLAPQPQAADGARESWLIVPLVTRSGVTGAITWRVAETRPAYEMHDLRLAQDLARRCALAIDNARLYREARVAISIRDEFMSVAAHELKTPMTSLRGYAQLLGREFDKGEVSNPCAPGARR